MPNTRSIFVDHNHDLTKALKEFYLLHPYGNRKYYGVTRVLNETKPQEAVDALEAWKAKVGEVEAERIVTESINIGNSLDMIIEKYLTTDFIQQEYKSEVGMPLFNQMHPVLKKIKPIGTQIHLYSDKYRVQGYLDCVGIMNQSITMIDFKNSRRKKDIEHIHDYFLQAAMYCIILHEMTGIVIKDICIILGIRNDNVPQIARAKLIDYIKPAKERLNKFKEIKGNKK